MTYAAITLVVLPAGALAHVGPHDNGDHELVYLLMGTIFGGLPIIALVGGFMLLRHSDKEQEGNIDMNLQLSNHQLANEPTQPKGGGKKKMILTASVVFGATLALTAGGLFLFGGSGKDAGTQVARGACVDGTIMTASETQLVLQTNKGSREFVVEKDSLEVIDIPHMQSHAAIGLQTRVYYEKKSGKEVATVTEDAPVNTPGSPQPVEGTGAPDCKG